MTKKDNVPTLDEWKKLYELMQQVKELAPWEIMHEDDIFGVQIPETGELGFVSVMGSLGEHLSVAIYQGQKSLNSFWDMQEMGEKLTPEFILQIPQLQASLVDLEDITDQDRKTIKTLGLKFRGKKDWPQFRGYRPSFIPWYIESEEARMLIYGLEQLLNVAPRFEEDPCIFSPTDYNNDYLMRVQEEDGQWKDTIWSAPEKEKEKPLELTVSMDGLNRLKRIMPGEFVIEVDLYMMPEPVQDKKNERPFFPYMFMLADHNSGMILGMEMLTPVPSLEAMWKQIPDLIIKNFLKGAAPREIHLKNEMLAMIIEPLAGKVGFKVKRVSRLSAIESVRKEMEKMMNRMF